MYFTNGDHQAFESLMRDKPGAHYDSGAAKQNGCFANDSLQRASG